MSTAVNVSHRDDVVANGPGEDGRGVDAPGGQLVASPELVLVDPALARLARARLPEEPTRFPANGASPRRVSIPSARPSADVVIALESSPGEDGRGVEDVHARGLVVSPELVLVDPALAQLARARLAQRPTRFPAVEEIKEEPSASQPRTVEPALRSPSGPAPSEDAATVGTLPTEARRRRWKLRAAPYVLSVATSVLIVALVGLGRHTARISESPRPSSADAGGSAARGQGASARRGARPTIQGSTVRGGHSKQRARTVKPPRRNNRVATVRRRRASLQNRVAAPPPNVLGLVVTPANGFVSLRWAQPPRQDHIVVFREREVRARRTTTYRDGMVVYRGRAHGLKDRGVRRGVTYRYVVVNYDRAGDASSGVTTVVVSR